MSCMAFLHARLGLGPLLRAEPVQHRRGTGIGGAIFLNQVEPRERNVELGLLGEFQNHEFDGEAVLHNLFQALVLRDAVFHVDHVIADGQVAEVGDKGRGLRLACGSGRAATSASSERSLAPKSDQVAHRES